MKLLVTIFMLLLFTAGSAEARAPRIGEPVANFTLTDLSGKKFDITQLKGRTTVLYFWNNLCGCTEQMIALKSFVTSQKGLAASFVTVNEGQGKTIAASVINTNKLPYVALLDDDLSVGKKLYGIKVLPTIFIVDKQGILREKLIGVVDNRRLEALIKRYL